MRGIRLAVSSVPRNENRDMEKKSYGNINEVSIKRTVYTPPLLSVFGRRCILPTRSLFLIDLFLSLQIS